MWSLAAFTLGEARDGGRVKTTDRPATDRSSGMSTQSTERGPAWGTSLSPDAI